MPASTCSKCGNYNYPPNNTLFWANCARCGAVNHELLPQQNPVLAMNPQPTPILVPKDEESHHSAIVVRHTTREPIQGRLLALLPPNGIEQEWRLVLRIPLRNALDEAQNAAKEAQRLAVLAESNLANLKKETEKTQTAMTTELDAMRSKFERARKDLEDVGERAKKTDETKRRLEADMAKVRTALGTQVLDSILLKA